MKSVNRVAAGGILAADTGKLSAFFAGMGVIGESTCFSVEESSLERRAHMAGSTDSPSF
jgi:hypothetical protein